jgi:hypothetical protein
MSSINELRAHIPHEPRDAAQADQQAVNTYVSAYNRSCMGGGSGPSRGFPSGGGNNAANALGAGAMALGDLANLLDELDQAERQNVAARQQAILEELLRDAEERAALAKARTAAAAAKEGDDAKREAMANPFASGSNPFAARPAKPAPAQPAKTTATTAPAAPKPKSAAATGASEAGSDPPWMRWVRDPTPANCAAAPDEIKQKSAAWYDSCVPPNEVANNDPNGNGGRPPKRLKPLPNHNGSPVFGGPAPDSDTCTGTRDALGACWIIPPRDLATAPNDDGAECGAYDGHRSRGQCVAPWDDQTPADCVNNVGGIYSPADDDHPYSTCAYGAPPNAAITDEGPEDSQSCGDLGGMTHHHGECWALGLTHDDCDAVGGTIVDSGGFQYCAYNAAAAAAQPNPPKAEKKKTLSDRLRDVMSSDDGEPSADAAPPVATPPFVQGLGHASQGTTQTSIGAVHTQPAGVQDSLPQQQRSTGAAP